MKKTIKLLLLLIGSFSLIGLIYFFIRFIIGYKKDYDYNVMDWNGDGKTSISEIIDSSEIGARQIVLNEIECVEYFFYKDGLPIKIVCR